MCAFKVLRSEGKTSDDHRRPRSQEPPSGPLRITNLTRKGDGEGTRRGTMSLPALQQLLLLCLLWCFGWWSTSDASPFDQWEDGIELRKVRGIESEDLSDALLRDQDDDQVQNVFKRFLFHYSKARNSVGAVQQTSNSVHPLMRLSPKLSQRRKKVVLLIRALPDDCCEGM